MWSAMWEAYVKQFYLFIFSVLSQRMGGWISLARIERHLFCHKCAFRLNLKNVLVSSLIEYIYISMYFSGRKRTPDEIKTKFIFSNGVFARQISSILGINDVIMFLLQSSSACMYFRFACDFLTVCIQEWVEFFFLHSHRLLPLLCKSMVIQRWICVCATFCYEKKSMKYLWRYFINIFFYRGFHFSVDSRHQNKQVKNIQI